MQFITNPAAQPVFTVHATDESADEGELLRLASEVQTLIRGASIGALALLGEQTLRGWKQSVDDANAQLMKAAEQVKIAINSSISTADLAALGPAKLRELAARAGVKVGPANEFDGYSLNSFLDEAARSS
jgi:hypothetical protein